MLLHEIFTTILNTSKRSEKEDILKENDSPLIRLALDYTYNPYRQYHLAKVPKIKGGDEIFYPNDQVWEEFFSVLDRLNDRVVTGHTAINEVVSFLGKVDPLRRGWMIRVLKRHLNIGMTANTANKVYGNIIPTFKVQLAKVFEEKRVAGERLVATEPKLDGVRCIAVSRNGVTTLYSRNGKSISDNYKETIIRDISNLTISGKIPKEIVLDGELMGSDFTATVSQFRKKTGADTSGHFYHVFDWMPYDDWVNQNPTLTCQETREQLEDMSLESNSRYLRLVKRDIVAPDKVREMHNVYVAEGYEGVMIKTLGTRYKFGRGFNVTKLKDFYDSDLEVVRFEEGEGKYSGKLGAIVVKNKDVLVNVGSGFTDADREMIWNDRNKFRGMIAEIRYQEETPDGSLRFPTFRGWRPDKK
jgi:DNA ligase-1